jgi:hypothetical protein
VNSKYLQDENTADWKRLCNFPELSDDEFDKTFRIVESKYNNREYLEIGIVLHIFCLLLTFSNSNIYQKSKSKILEEAKLYIDLLRHHNKSNLINLTGVDTLFGGFEGISFNGKDYDEYKELYSYMETVRNLAIDDKLPNEAQNLLNIMRSDTTKFIRLITITNIRQDREFDPRYYEAPILNCINPGDFLKCFLSMSYRDRHGVIWALDERYKLKHLYTELIQELDWLRTFHNLVLLEISNKMGRNSGFILDRYVKPELEKTISKLESGVRSNQE